MTCRVVRGGVRGLKRGKACKVRGPRGEESAASWTAVWDEVAWTGERVSQTARVPLGRGGRGRDAARVRGVPHGVGPAGAHRWIAVFDSQGVEGIVLLAGTGGGYQTRTEYVVAAGREGVGRRASGRGGRMLRDLVVHRLEGSRVCFGGRVVLRGALRAGAVLGRLSKTLAELRVIFI